MTIDYAETAREWDPRYLKCRDGFAAFAQEYAALGLSDGEIQHAVAWVFEQRKPKPEIVNPPTADAAELLGKDEAETVAASDQRERVDARQPVSAPAENGGGDHIGTVREDHVQGVSPASEAEQTIPSRAGEDQATCVREDQSTIVPPARGPDLPMPGKGQIPPVANSDHDAGADARQSNASEATNEGVPQQGHMSVVASARAPTAEKGQSTSVSNDQSRGADLRHSIASDAAKGNVSDRTNEHLPPAREPTPTPLTLPKGRTPPTPDDMQDYFDFKATLWRYCPLGGKRTFLELTRNDLINMHAEAARRMRQSIRTSVDDAYDYIFIDQTINNSRNKSGATPTKKMFNTSDLAAFDENARKLIEQCAGSVAKIAASYMMQKTKELTVAATKGNTE